VDIEEVIARYHPRLRAMRCRDCGKRVFRGSQAFFCRGCLRERRRKGQRQRRAFAAGLLVRLPGQGKWGCCAIVPAKYACARCGAEFRPRRTTARYCSTRCRVAAHREKGGRRQKRIS
jgi:DNA-directed RNA polymerase subunit RPC12/RpoP